MLDNKYLCHRIKLLIFIVFTYKKNNFHVFKIR